MFLSRINSRLRNKVIELPGISERVIGRITTPFSLCKREFHYLTQTYKVRNKFHSNSNQKTTSTYLVAYKTLLLSLESNITSCHFKSTVLQSVVYQKNHATK